jgi:hypothetical protein
MVVLGFPASLDSSHSPWVRWQPYPNNSLSGDQFWQCGNFPLNQAPHCFEASGKLLQKSSRIFGVEHEEGSSSKGIYVLLSFLKQPIVESLAKFPIFHAGGWEIYHGTMLALPCLGERLIRKLLEAHPWLSSITLLAGLSNEKSQKSCRNKSRHKPREWVVNCRWLGSNKKLPCEQHKQQQGSR